LPTWGNTVDQLGLHVPQQGLRSSQVRHSLRRQCIFLTERKKQSKAKQKQNKQTKETTQKLRSESVYQTHSVYTVYNTIQRIKTYTDMRATHTCRYITVHRNIHVFILQHTPNTLVCFMHVYTHSKVSNIGIDCIYIDRPIHIDMHTSGIIHIEAWTTRICIDRYYISSKFRGHRTRT
jgi:hypothetical protein